MLFSFILVICFRFQTFTADHIRPLTPVIEYPSEDAFLTEDPLEIMKSGRQHQIPMIIGYNSMEGLFFEIIRNMNSNSTKYSDLEANIPYQLKISRGTPTSKELTDIMKQFYFGDEKVSNEKSLNIYKVSVYLYVFVFVNVYMCAFQSMYVF